MEEIKGKALFFKEYGKWYDSVDFTISVEEDTPAFSLFAIVKKKFKSTCIGMHMVVIFNNGKHTYPFMVPAEKRKIVLTDLERKVLTEEKEKGYNYIARNANNLVFVYRDKPKKVIDAWLNDCLSFHPVESLGNLSNDCFKFIEFDSDDEPYVIENLLKGE